MPSPKIATPIIPRYNPKPYAGDAPAQDILAVFGSLAQGAPNFSRDVDAIQGQLPWSQGFQAAVVGNNSPALQDMNAVLYALSTPLCYLFQRGIPAWSENQSYYSGCFCSSGRFIYVSTADANLGQPVTNTNVWRLVTTQDSGGTTERPINVPAGFQYFDTDLGVYLVWDRNAWRTLSGSPGDVKEVDAPTLDDALARNPGWVQHTASLRRVIGAADASDNQFLNGAVEGVREVTISAGQSGSITFGPGFKTEKLDAADDTYALQGILVNGNPVGVDGVGNPFPPFSVSPTGQTPHNNIQPTMYLWRLVKL